MNLDLYNRILYFDKPFAYIVLNYKTDTFCSYCLQKPGYKLLFCGQCRFARYCNKDCQRSAWKDHHKPECQRLKKVFPNLPISDVILIGRILDRLDFIEKNGDVHNWQKDRKFDDLMSHQAEIRVNDSKMEYYQKMRNKLAKYMGEEWAASVDEEKIFLTFCRTWINSHSIHTNAGTEIGLALDLGVSRYDHSCRPNLTLVFDGFRAVLRPLATDVDAHDTKKSFIAYVDIGRSRYQRRNELRSKWYFTCQCDRCNDPEDDFLTAIKCPNSRIDCKEAIVITEDSKPVELTCSACGEIVTKERVEEAQEFMKNLPNKFAPEPTQEQVEQMGRNLERANMILHPKNIYFCRLQTAYMQVCGAQDCMLRPDMQKIVYENYRRCLPKADRHIGYQLLHLVKALIQEGRRDEAVQYAYEAMTIFEICFGLQHPYYLQTLALWTFLDTRADKTNQELIALMNFNYNKPVDISPYLERSVAVKT